MTFFSRPGRLIPVLFCFLGMSLFAQEVSYPPLAEEDVPVMEGEGITITGTRETTQLMKTVTREMIEKAHAPDLAALLEETAGLGIARYGPRGSQGDINIRGFDSERVAFLIDGVPAGSPGSGEFDFYQIDLDAIERIEVIYGGSDSRYNVSGAIGGVINIVTVKKQEPGLRISGGLSNISAMPGRYYSVRAGADKDPQWQDLLDTQNINLSAGLGLEHFSWSASWFGNRAGNHFLYEDPYGRTRRKESSEVWDTGASSAFIWELPDLSKLIINGNFYYGDKNVPKNGYSETGDKQYDLSSRENIMLEMPRAFHDDLSMEFSLSHSLQRADMIASAGSLSRTNALMAINRWAWYPLQGLILRAGGDYRYAFLDTGVFHDRHDGGLYLSAEWSPRGGLTVIPSVKLAFQNGSSPVPAPKLGLLWKPTDALTIKNNYFRSFKFPDLDDLYWQMGGFSGNADLEPEDGWGADLGAAWKRRTGSGLGLGVEGTGFVQWYDNSIHWYNRGGLWQPQNVGGAFFYGSDAAARLELPLKKGALTKLAFSLSYQFMMNYLLAYGYNFASDKRIPYMPVHSAGASAELTWKTGSASVSGRFEGQRYVERQNITFLKPHFLLTLSVDQKIGKNLAAFAVIHNALNTSYQSFYDYPMPGITVTAGLKTSFGWKPQSQTKEAIDDE
jgi:vitamin B12 transporter